MNNWKLNFKKVLYAQPGTKITLASLEDPNVIKRMQSKKFKEDREKRESGRSFVLRADNAKDGRLSKTRSQYESKNSSKSFKQAFADAEKAGDMWFGYKGKVYRTDKGTRDNRDNMAALYGANLGWTDELKKIEGTQAGADAAAYRRNARVNGATQILSEDVVPVKAERQPLNIKLDPSVRHLQEFEPISLVMKGVPDMLVSGAVKGAKDAYNGLATTYDYATKFGDEAYNNYNRRSQKSSEDYARSVAATNAGLENGYGYGAFNIFGAMKNLDKMDKGDIAGGALHLGMQGLESAALSPAVNKAITRGVDQAATRLAPRIATAGENGTLLTGRYITKGGTVPQGEGRMLNAWNMNSLSKGGNHMTSRGLTTSWVPSDGIVQYGNRSMQRALNEGLLKGIQGYNSAARWGTGAMQNANTGKVFVWHGAPQVGYDVAAENAVAISPYLTGAAAIAGRASENEYNKSLEE